MMDWKDINEQPPQGTFEKIQRRLRRRRALRIGLPLAAVIVAVAAAVAVLGGKTNAERVESPSVDMPQMMSAVDPEMKVFVTDEREVKHEDAQAKEENPTISSNSVSPMEVSAVAPLAQVQPKVVETKEVFPDIDMPKTVVASKTGRDVQEEKPVMLTAVPKTDSVLSTSSSSLNSKVGEPTPEPYHEDDLVWAPNIITPNSDVDENRVFKLRASSVLSDFHVHIYNRRGQRLFSSTDINETWNATFNGAIVSQGAYVWVASFRDVDGKPHTVTGTVVVVR